MGAPAPTSIEIFDISSLDSPGRIAYIPGRQNIFGGGMDDEFTIPIGNLLVISDDEKGVGSGLAVQDVNPDTTPPEVVRVSPANGAMNVDPRARVSVAFSDTMEFTTVNETSFIVRSSSGEVVNGRWGIDRTIVHFWPEDELDANTGYEIILPAGRVADAVGNTMPEDFRAVFATAAAANAPPCVVNALAPTEVGQTISLSAGDAGSGASYVWDSGIEGSAPANGQNVQQDYPAAGRYAIRLTVTRNGVARSCSATQVVHRALSLTPSVSSQGMIASANQSTVWVVNPDANTIAAIDADFSVPANNRLEAGAGVRPTTLAEAPDGTIWVVNQESFDITVHNASTGSIMHRIGLPVGSYPHSIVFAANQAYVSLEGSGAVVRVDPASRQITASLQLPGGGGVLAKVRGLAYHPGSQTLLVTRLNSHDGRGILYRINLASFALAGQIVLQKDTTPDTTNGGRGVPNYISQIAISPDGTQAVVPSKKDNIDRGLNRDGLALNHENAVRTIASFVDLPGFTEDPTQRFDFDNQDMAFGATFSPKGDLIFVTTQGTNQVNVLDAYSRRQITGSGTGLAPRSVVLVGDRLFVQNFMGRSVSVFNAAGVLGGSDLELATIATVPTVGLELLSPPVLKGKQLFYDAGTRRMNQDGYLSCASCHLDGGEDSIVWDFTDRGEGFRNTITLRGRAGVGHGPVHWSGNFDEIQDFENDIRFHFGGRGLMRNNEFNAGSRSNPLGDPKAGVSEDLDALAAYVTTLNATRTSPYRAQNGDRTADAIAGQAVFASLNCVNCHSGSEFTDSALNVHHNVGTLKPTSGKRLGQPLTGLDTPTLKGVWHSAPYLHDGSAPTLASVLATPGHGNAQGLSTAQRDSLVSYLLQLDDSEDQILEAEDAALLGGVEFRADNPGYSGAGYADFPIATGNQIRVRWDFAAVQSGSYVLEFHYANGASDRPLSLSVNGQVVGELRFPSTGNWGTYAIQNTAQISLRPGRNQIELIALNDYGANIDYMRIRRISAAPPPGQSSMIEAETGMFSGGVASASKAAGYTGTGYADFPNASGEHVKAGWTKVAPVDGAYTMTVRYANGSGNRPLRLRVNSALVVNRIDFPSTGDWFTWRTVTIPNVPLRTGLNTIELIATENRGGNIDSITFERTGDVNRPAPFPGPTQRLQLEAEFGYLMGGVVFASGAGGYTGTGYADYPDRTGDQVLVRWLVNQNQAGARQLRFRYANGSSNRPLSIRVNGTTVHNNVPFPNSGGWFTWRETASRAVQLEAGVNLVELVSTSSKGANVDALIVD